MPKFIVHNSHAIQLLHKACTPHGIVASVNNIDNYNRIWARDSVIAGLAGLFINDSVIIEGLKQSLITLQHRQAETGQIPSNVKTSPAQVGEPKGLPLTISTAFISTTSSPSEESGEASYGGLTGRVDATTWWIIGVCAYLKHTSITSSANKKNINKLSTAFISTTSPPSEESEEASEAAFYRSVVKAFQVLQAWEMNGRGLLYSPLGGNWADEYVTQGYTLYDNCLYLWALEAAAEVFDNQAFYKKSQQLRKILQTNFYLKEKLTAEKDYHPTARQNATEKPPYWVAALAPNGYDTRFDMAGNALAEYLRIDTTNTTTQHLNDWLTQRAAVQKNWLLPVFYPVIYQNDPDWRLLHNNFAYNFKNNPHHFHNGGCWFVWLGFLGMALRNNGCSATADAIATQINTSLTQENPPYTFNEYWATDSFEPGGTKNLCFSASGSIFSWQ